MTTVAGAAQRARSGPGAPSGRAQFIRFPIALSMAELGVVFLVSAFVDLFDERDVTWEFLAATLVCAVYGGTELTRVPRPRVTSAPAVMTMATLSFATLALGGALAHLIGDATDDVGTAILEGTAPVTTTAMTGLDIDSLPDGLIMFRALMQWIGGLGALVVAFIVIPIVFGGGELMSRGQSEKGHRSLVRGRTQGAERIVAIYGGFTAVMVLAYATAGLGALDAVGNAMATVSTGGLSTRTGSLDAFDSGAVEWVAAGGMALAGVNLGVVWWIIRGDRAPVARSTEFRTYVLVMIGAIVAVALWKGSDYDAAGSIRTASVAVTSAMSTTGFTTTSWWLFDEGAQALLLALIGIGAMSGSAGGGFRYLRVLEAFRFATRELRRQLHPSAIAVVRINGRAIEERTLQRMTGYIVVFTLTVATGGMLIELGDSTVTPSAAISLSLSALSTAGPQVVDPVDFSSLGTVTKLTLSALMLLGRLSIYAVLVAVINGLIRLFQSVERGWHGRRRR